MDMNSVSENTTEGLAPCPFCGGKAAMHKLVNHTFMVTCFGDCYQVSLQGDTKEEARVRWNTRVVGCTYIEQVGTLNITHAGMVNYTNTKEEPKC